jgi:hypothetical protein
MRSIEAKHSRVLFTLVSVVFVGLVWGAMASGVLHRSAPAAPQAAVDVRDQVYRAVLVTGTIRPAETNLLGGVKTVQIVVPRVGSFRIADSGKGRDLKDHVGETVTVMAMSRIDSGGNQILRVEDYSIDAS